ncbi:glycerophosphodiester phosphodiesterase family protein [Enterococcus faecium]|uniref:glycerophosphodiester phosphodiesterase family protein n=1 Tax=Enterococcus faecium TaxID=1352 RepID=UPI003D1A0388
MASSLYNLALDFSKELNYTKAIMARQGDKGITVTVKPFLNGLQMDTSGGTFTLKGTTPSNRYVDSVATSVTSEEVTFSLDGTFMSEAGYYKHCYVEYRKDDQILTTQDIIFFSLGVSDISQGQADEYVSQLEELIRKYNETFDAFMAEIKGKVDSLNQQITDLTGQAKTLQDKLDALKEEISKLGNLQVMYSNSIEFGDYDYSGRANLAPNLDFSKFSGNGITMTKPLACFKDHETYLELDSSDPSAVNTSRNIYVPNCSALLPNNTYIMTVPIMINADFDDFRTAFVLKTRDGTALGTVNPPRENVGTWQNVTKVFTVPSNLKFDNTYLQLWQPIEGNGKLYIGYDIKIEKVTSTSDTATPYQPNLLDAPYYLSKVSLGKNIADPTAVFPISTSDYLLYNKRNIENYEAGQTYTLTMKATKPASQSFRVFIGSGTQLVGTMIPVEGKVGEWKITFTVSQGAIDAGTTNILQVYQYPNTSLGACQIDWLKIEKGNTRTPNIEQYKYRGIGMRDSNNPKDYVWDLAPEYVEDNLATDIKVAEITGKVNNYTDGKVAIVNKNLSDISADLNKQIANNKNNIATNTTNISTNTTAISTLQNKNLFTQNKSTHGLTWIAHRGNNSTAPENSIVAFENVYRHQAIETDIQLTSDNRWVVMHDETVDRTTNGTGKISDMTYDQFRALRIDTGANIDKLTDDEKIPPNLEEFLLICKKNNRIPVVEIKATGGYTKEQLQLIKTISDGIGMTEKTIFISFNYDMLVLMREIFPFNELQWVYQGTINTDVITKLKTLGLPCGLDINENNASLTKDNVNLLHANRLKIGAWTVGYNSFEKMKDLGIDYITTNSPSGYLKYAELSLRNGFTPTNDNGKVPQFAAELEGGYVFLSFNVKDGTNNNQLTEIAKLPDWAIPHEKQYNQCMIRTSSGVSLATFDTQGWKHSTGVTEGTITIGLGWSSRTTWAAGQCIYKID